MCSRANSSASLSFVSVSWLKGGQVYRHPRLQCFPSYTRVKVLSLSRNPTSASNRRTWGPLSLGVRGGQFLLSHKSAAAATPGQQRPAPVNTASKSVSWDCHSRTVPAGTDRLCPVTQDAQTAVRLSSHPRAGLPGSTSLGGRGEEAGAPHGPPTT